MSIFSTFSIRIKLIAIITLVSGLSSLIGISTIFFINYNAFKDSLIHRAEFTATLIGNYSVPDLLFEDKVAARETLSHLSTIPNIEIALLFNKDDALFSTYRPQQREDSEHPALLASFNTLKHDFFTEKNTLMSGLLYDSLGFPSQAYVFRSVLDNHSSKIGTLYIQFNTHEFISKIKLETLLFLIVLGVTFLIALLLSLFFQRLISTPILKLSECVNDVANTKDFSKKITPMYNDEIGSLYAGTQLLFNEIEESQNTILLAKEKAENANKEKSKFLAKISHELRTPLNSLLLLANDLIKNKKNHLDEDEIESATIIHRSGQTLLRLINNLLDLAKVEANKDTVSTTSIKVNPFLKELEKVFLPFAKEKELEFNVSLLTTDTTIITDEDKLNIILNNLLSNAFKFTHNGHISLDVHVHDVSKTITFTISDSGIGIPKNEQDTLFDEFSQAHQKSSSSYPGTGLGLAITKKLVTLLEGSIHFESIEGKGSSFRVTLPT